MPWTRALKKKLSNRSFPNCLIPQCWGGSSCDTILMEIYFHLHVHFHANQSRFHMKSFAQAIILKQRQQETRKLNGPFFVPPIMQLFCTDILTHLDARWPCFLSKDYFLSQRSAFCKKQNRGIELNFFSIFNFFTRRSNTLRCNFI